MYSTPYIRICFPVMEKDQTTTPSYNKSRTDPLHDRE